MLRRKIMHSFEAFGREKKILAMRQYTSNYGSQNPKLLIQAINLGIKLFLLQKKEKMRWGGYMLMIWVLFMMGETWLSRDSDSCIRQSHYCSAQGCQRSCFKCVSLPENYLWPFVLNSYISKTRSLLKKKGQKWEEMNMDAEHQYWRRYFQNRQEHNGWLCRFPDFSRIL